MTIALDKILVGVSVVDYCKSHGASMRDYTLRGVHIFETPRSYNSQCTLETFANEVPDEAEVVVEFTSFVAMSKYSTIYAASGVALIPRLDNDNEADRE